LGLVTLQKLRLAVPTLREAEAARNTSDVYVDRQLLTESACGDSPLDDPLSAVLLPDDPLADVPHCEARPAGSVGEE